MKSTMTSPPPMVCMLAGAAFKLPVKGRPPLKKDGLKCLDIPKHEIMPFKQVLVSELGGPFESTVFITFFVGFRISPLEDPRVASCFDQDPYLGHRSWKQFAACFIPC